MTIGYGFAGRVSTDRTWPFSVGRLFGMHWSNRMQMMVSVNAIGWAVGVILRVQHVNAH